MELQIVSTYYVNGISTPEKSKYFKGKIYTIRSFKTDKIYIGSTTQLLHKRFYQHMDSFRRGNMCCSSSEIIKYGDAYIELLESYPSFTKEELTKKERECIRKNKDICVNCFTNTKN
jgi:hypothetical protein